MRQTALLLRAVGTPHWRGCSVLSARRQDLSLYAPHNKLCGVNRISCLWHASLSFKLFNELIRGVNTNVLIPHISMLTSPCSHLHAHRSLPTAHRSSLTAHPS
ncbi:MAG: hypothetical protein IKO62_05635 [Bacteroidales bacterium]|nr:hypothetical protein [Bacteroidales bacterium]